MANVQEWRRDFQRGKAARLNGELEHVRASDAWRHGWRQQDAVLKAKPKIVSNVPVTDPMLMRRRMMGSGRFVR